MIKSIELPAKAKDWTNDHLDEALRRICDAQNAIAAARANYNDELLRAKTKFDKVEKSQKGVISALRKSIKAAAEKLQAAWQNKSLKLSWGTVGFRTAPRHLVLKDDVSEEDAVKYLLYHGYDHAVKTVRTVNLEVVEKLSDQIIDEAGYRWADARELFEIKTKLDLEAEQPKLKKPAA